MGDDNGIFLVGKLFFYPSRGKNGRFYGGKPLFGWGSFLQEPEVIFETATEPTHGPLFSACSGDHGAQHIGGFQEVRGSSCRKPVAFKTSTL